MKAILCTQFGGPELLQYGDAETPKLGAHDVRILVKAAGVNFPDTLTIQGKYQFKPEPPFVPGAEVAGVVQEVGAKVTHLRAGDSVASVSVAGGFAEQTVVDAGAVVPIPAGVDFSLAAAFPMAYGTTMHALKQRGALKSGETLLVLGAAGGVGLAAVQVGKAMGARVIAAASSDEKLAVCKQHGADELINYADGDLKSKVKALTKGQGADVIYDPVGGELFGQALSSVAWNGRILVIGFAAGQIPQIPANKPLLKGCAVVGVFWGAFVAREPRVNAENFEQLFQWFGEGKIKPHVSKSYPLAEAGQALQDMLDRKATGKLVLIP